MPRVQRLNIMGESDEEKHKHYEAVDVLYRKGKEVKTKEHRSGFPAITVDCENIHLLTDCLSLETWFATFAKNRPRLSSDCVILDQRLPAPDEAPLTMCPWCGEEYQTTDPRGESDYETIIEPMPGTSEVARHKCGNLVRFIAPEI